MNNMAQARYSGFVLFNGVLTRAADLGISYFPKWFIISTPIPYLLFGLFGLVLISWRLIRKPIKFLDTYENRLQFIFAVCFGAPIALILIFNPILYDGWRHLYFVYPPFVFLCIYGVNYIIEKWGETIPYMILVITFGFIITFMYNNFPLQYVYFNRLVNTQTHDHLRYQYDLEYWGISYKQCLEYILENDQSKTINVFVEGAAGRYNLNILPNSYRDRIRYVDIIDAKYVITNLRTNPIGFEEFQNKIWHSIQVGNNTVAIIYKIHE